MATRFETLMAELNADPRLTGQARPAPHEYYDAVRKILADDVRKSLEDEKPPIQFVFVPESVIQEHLLGVDEEDTQLLIAMLLRKVAEWLFGVKGYVIEFNAAGEINGAVYPDRETDFDPDPVYDPDTRTLRVSVGDEDHYLDALELAQRNLRKRKGLRP